MTEPLVSVIVPAWNSQWTLRQTLESVAAQTCREIEIVIVDDGSTDGTAAVAEAFCASEPRAKLVGKKNGGLAAARNCGIENSRGDWVAPMDADDVWHPTKIEKQLRVARSSPEPVGFVYCWYRQIDGEGRILSSGPRVALSGRILNQLAYFNAVENGSALLLSRKAVDDVGGYDESLPAYEDVMLQLRIAERWRIALVPEHLVGWRRHSTNMSSDIDLIARCARQVYRQLLSDHLLDYPGIARWVAGRNAFDTAEQRGAAGRPLAALGWLSESLRRDPARNGLQLFYRLARSARRRLSVRRQAAIQPMFADIDPAAEIVTDPFAMPGLAAMVANLDRNRLFRLRKLDAERPLPSDGGQLPAESARVAVDCSDARQGKKA